MAKDDIGKWNLYKGCGIPFSRKIRKRIKGQSEHHSKSIGSVIYWPVGRWAHGKT